MNWRDIFGRGETSSRDHCGACRHFRNEPGYLEAEIPGLSSLSSGAASVRADDGVCMRHGLYLAAGNVCAQFDLASALTSAPESR
jgi:hypothetical protein